MKAGANKQSISCYQATPYSVKKEKEANTSHIKKENFNIRKEYLHKNKQGPNKDAPYAMHC